MFSLGTASIFVTLFGAFVSASPVSVDRRAPAVVDTRDIATVDILSKRDEPRPLVAIFADIKVSLGVAVGPLNGITPEGCTSDVVGPVVNNVQGILGGAVAEINALVNVDVSIALATADGKGVLGVGDVANLVVEILAVILNPYGDCYKVAGGNTEIIGLLGGVGSLLSELVKAVLALVPALLATLNGLLGGLVGIIANLNLGVLVSVLGINIGLGVGVGVGVGL